MEEDKRSGSGEVETAEPDGEVPRESTIRARLYKLAYDQPDVILSLVEELMHLLVSRGSMKGEEIELLMQSAIKRWLEAERT